MCKTSILNIFSLFIQLYIDKVPIESGSGENYPDPTKQDPDPQPCFMSLASVMYSRISWIWVPPKNDKFYVYFGKHDLDPESILKTADLETQEIRAP